jgi:Tfp pilus assembly protein PilN
MIRVNLMRDRTTGFPSKFAAPAAARTGVIYALILLLATGGMAAWHCRVNRQVAAAVKKRAGLQARETRLHEVEKEIEEFQKTTKLLQNRVEAIERLKESQTVPALLLGTVLESIPQRGNLWLISLIQNSDNTKIVGFAQQTEAVPDLMSNLISSGIFEAVELEGIENHKEASEFSLLCRNLRNTPR